MRDLETFETRLATAYRRFADEVTTEVDPMALARTIALRPVRTPHFVPRFRPLRLAVVLGLLAVVGLAAAVVVGNQPSPPPAPALVSNGWIAFAASPLTAGMFNGDGEHRDIYLTREGTAARRIIGVPGDGRSQGCPRFSPDGSMLAYTEGDETVGKHDLEGRTPVTNRAVVLVALGADGEPSSAVLRVPLPMVPGPLPCPEWSPIGSNLAFFTGAEVWIADVGSGVISILPVEPIGTDDLRFPEWRFLDMEWSPDSASVAVGESGRIRVVPIDGTEPTVLPIPAVTAYSMGWLAGGRQLAYLDGPWGPADIHIVELKGGGDRLLLAGVESFVVSSDGSRLAYDTGDGPIMVMDVDGPNVITLPEFGSGLLWSPDGQRLLSRGYWGSDGVASELLTVAVIPDSTAVITPFPDVSFEWMSISHVSWQPVLTASTVPGATPRPRSSATARPSPSAVPVAAPAVSRATIGASGTTATAIGQLSWTKVQGDASNVPFGQILDTPSGFAAIEPDLDRRGSRFWTSADGVDWVITPMPVPAAGVVGMGQTAGEHWIWSQTDFRLWRSSDFATWTEFDLDARKPPAIEGVDWEFSPSGPVTVGTTTVLPGHVYGTLAVGDLLGIPLAPGERLTPTNRGDPQPVPGERDIYRGRTTVIGSDGDDRVKVGSIRVEVDGAIVTVYDAGRDVPIARIDATTVGIPAADLAGTLEEDLYIDGPGDGVVIADGEVQGFTPPPGDVTYLDAREGRFIALTEDDQGIPGIVWTSANGLDWESLGPPVLPLSSGTPRLGLLERSPSDPGEPLTAAVLITEDEDTQRMELWSSTDGQRWITLGPVYTYPGTSLNPMRAPTGYLATGDDFRIHVSATGAEWSIVDGPKGVGRSLDEVGGARMTSSTSAGAFTLEAATDGARTLWAFTLEPVATPSP